MTPERFRACLDALFWSGRLLAALLDIDERQVRRWASGQYEIPPDIAAWLERRAQAMEADPPPRG